MGLFDYVYVDRPDLGVNPMTEFQTKDTDEVFGGLWMRRFDITRDGRLICHDVEFELVPKEELPYPDVPFIGSIRPKSTTLREVDFHGILRMTNCDTYQEWSAKFTDGRLVSLEAVK